MPKIDHLFPTKLFRDELPDLALAAELEAACRSIAEDDAAGQRWCRKNAYPGYTSYASLNDLPWRVPAFAELVRALDRCVAAFAKDLEFNLGDRTLQLDSLWINILESGGVHTSHIHPQSVVSGTYYVVVPKGASAIKFEDPRLGSMMAAPPRMTKARPENRQFLSVAPKPGTVLLWESWLRHEVPMNAARSERISISFNYRWR